MLHAEPPPVGRVQELIGSLQTIDDRGPALERLMPELRALLGAEQSIGYRVVGVEGSFGVDFAYGSGLDIARAVPVFERFIRAVPAFGLYNPARPEPDQRNRVLRMEELLPAGRSLPIKESVFPRIGIRDGDQLRALICHGETLLAWVGAFREEPFGDKEAGLLAALVSPLQRRLFLEQQLEQQRLSAATLDAVLEALPLPTLLFDGRGRVDCANLAGRVWLDANGRAGRAALAEAAKGQGPKEIGLTPIALGGVPRAFLATIHPKGGNAKERARRAALRFRLTPRQTEVLEQLAQGCTNKSIAAALQCSVKTVELHVSAILHKAGAGSRAELLAGLVEDGFPLV
jgi:DNA-binding CsgD family transcriptional regulator